MTFTEHVDEHLLDMTWLRTFVRLVMVLLFLLSVALLSVWSFVTKGSNLPFHDKVMVVEWSDKSDLVRQVRHWSDIWQNGQVVSAMRRV